MTTPNSSFWSHRNKLVAVLLATAALVLSAATSAFGAAGPPGPPTLNSVTPGNNSVTLNYDQPATDGGSPLIQIFVAVATPAAPSTYTYASCPLTGTTCTVNGLTNGSTYRFTVLSKNALGYGTSKVGIGIPGLPGQLNANYFGINPGGDTTKLPPAATFGTTRLWDTGTKWCDLQPTSAPITTATLDAKIGPYIAAANAGGYSTFNIVLGMPANWVFYPANNESPPSVKASATGTPGPVTETTKSLNSTTGVADGSQWNFCNGSYGGNQLPKYGNHNPATSADKNFLNFMSYAKTVMAYVKKNLNPGITRQVELWNEIGEHGSLSPYQGNFGPTSCGSAACETNAANTMASFSGWMDVVNYLAKVDTATNGAQTLGAVLFQPGNRVENAYLTAMNNNSGSVDAVNIHVYNYFYDSNGVSTVPNVSGKLGLDFFSPTTLANNLYNQQQAQISTVNRFANLKSKPKYLTETAVGQAPACWTACNPGVLGPKSASDQSTLVASTLMNGIRSGFSGVDWYAWNNETTTTKKAWNNPAVNMGMLLPSSDQTTNVATINRVKSWVSGYTFAGCVFDTAVTTNIRCSFNDSSGRKKREVSWSTVEGTFVSALPGGPYNVYSSNVVDNPDNNGLVTSTTPMKGGTATSPIVWGPNPVLVTGY